MISLFKKFFKPQFKRKAPRSAKDLKINRKAISKNVTKTIQRLNDAGYEAYLVGGGVRDLLVGLKPKDFDVATNARPEELRKLFRNCRLIGRRFRLAQIYFPNEIIEVATFRAKSEEASSLQHQNEEGLLVRDNVYGTLEDDSWRRDFTINALYYDLPTDNIVDLTAGLPDLISKQIRIIGEPIIRYREDPVRMLRAIRFAAKLNFNIEEKTAAPFIELQTLLSQVASSRLFDEFIKLFFSGHAYATYQQLCQHNFYEFLFPSTAKLEQKTPAFAAMVAEALRNTDERLATNKSINPAFLIAVMLWQPYQQHLPDCLTKENNRALARQQAMSLAINEQLQLMTIPKRFTLVVKEIWDMQDKFERRHGSYPQHLLEHKRFRAGYDFLLLRSQFEPNLVELVNWWTEYQTATTQHKEEMVAQFTDKPKRRKKRSRTKPASSHNN